MSTSSLDVCLTLAKTALAFGEVLRVTRHVDGVTRESDTTHTVMLTWIAVELARLRNTRPDVLHLDLGYIALFASVHDLPEVHAGDTNTLGITQEGRAQKKIQEEKALFRLLEEDLASAPALREFLLLYEQQQMPEARWVRLADKILPKLTHWLNQGAFLAECGHTPAAIHALHERQAAELAQAYPEFPDLIDLLREAGWKLVSLPGFEPPSPLTPRIAS